MSDGPDHPLSSPVMTVAGWDDNDSAVLNRELSWLAFNARVLAMAADPAVPLLEQVRYLAIFSRNLDEFYQVRVSGLWDQQAAGLAAVSADGRTAAEQLDLIRSTVMELSEEQERIYSEQVRPALADAGIELLDWEQLRTEEQAELSVFFRERIFPVLTPLAVDPGHPFPYVSDLSLNLAVVLRSPSDGRELFARVKIPDGLPRWHSVVPGHRFVPIEQVIARHLDQLFPGMAVIDHHPFRVTRNADLSDSLDEAEDLLSAVEFELRRRRFGRAIRLEVGSSISAAAIELLLREFVLAPSAVYPNSAPLDLTSLDEIADLPRPDVSWPEWNGVVPIRLQSEEERVDVFSAMRAGDIVVHHPYESFSHSVVEFIHQAARDPKVLAIKLTLYRTAGESPIVDALITAAERGKQVAVLVELKARFDEAANIGWGRRLEQAGAHVAYGILGLKIHSKTCMVVRADTDGIRRYCHVGTGNYNHRTARIYEDFGILTCDPEVGDDLATLFNRLTGYGRDISYRRLLVAPDHLRSGLETLIEREMASPNGRIVIKINSLVDVPMIEKLYEASQAGVQIDLIVRGSCSLRPGVPGLSDNIRVRSIVGRFLEHSRIYWFGNGSGVDQPAVFVGSADLMQRNLDRRIEVLLRVTDEYTRGRLSEVVDAGLAERELAWSLDADGVWHRLSSLVDGGLHRRLQIRAEERIGEEQGHG